MTQEELKQIIISGCKFRYKSYNFRAAKREFISTLDSREIPEYEESDKLCSDYMPKELKEKHLVWREGWLRKVDFQSNGNISRCIIGKHFMYSKSFTLEDFGESVFPLDL